MGKATFKVNEIDWGRYKTNDVDAAAAFVWAGKLGVNRDKVKAKMRGSDLVEIEVTDMDGNKIKEKLRKK